MSDQNRKLRLSSPPLPDPATLPPELLALPWVAANPVDKVPHNPKTGGKASPADPATGGTLEEAIAFARRRDWAVGVILTTAAGIVVVDVDTCRDPETGELTPEAKAIGHQLPTYTEPSISGCGLHFYAFGSLPPNGRKRGHVEMYSDARYVIVTGQPFAGRDQLTDCTVAIADLHRTIFPPAPPQAATPSASPWSTDIEALHKRCEGSAKFRTLFAGDTSDYGGDQSTAELGFINIIVRNGGTPEQADALYRSSGLCRAKWDERRGAQTYGERTIARAFDGTVQPFQPRRGRDGVNPQVADSDAVPLAATGTDDALPDDVDTLKAMIVALTHRVEAAEWRAEQAEARATRAEQRADMLSRVQSRTTGIISNSKLRQERFTAVALTNLFANREAAGDPGEDGLYAVPLARIAEVTGASADTISKHISTLADNGAVRKKLKWTPERVDTTTGEILPPSIPSDSGRTVRGNWSKSAPGVGPSDAPITRRAGLSAAGPTSAPSAAASSTPARSTSTPTE